MMCGPQASRPADGRGQRWRHSVLHRHGGCQETGFLLHRQRAAATGLNSSTGRKGENRGRDNAKAAELQKNIVVPFSGELGLFFRELVRETFAPLKPPLSTTRQMMWITDNNTRGIFYHTDALTLPPFCQSSWVRHRLNSGSHWLKDWSGLDLCPEQIGNQIAKTLWNDLGGPQNQTVREILEQPMVFYY